MVRFRALLIIGIVLVSGASLSSARAQSESPLADIGQLPGLEASVNRDYALDFSQFDSAESGDYRDALFFGGVVMEFDGPAHAADGYQALVEDGGGSLAASFGLDDAEIVDTPLAGLGDQAQAVSIFNDTGSTQGYLRQVVMQQEHYLFMAVIVTEAEASSLDADALVAFFSEQVSLGLSGVGTFDAAGGSHGGLWDFFPPADHALYGGLANQGDTVIHPRSDT